MAGPVVSWNTVPVFGTWKNIDGTSCTGFVKFTLNQRVGNTPQDTIFPKSGQLMKTLDSNGSIAFDCPVLDDPDNSPIDSSVQIFVEEVFRGSVGASYWIRPTLAMAPTGLDLRSIVVQDHIADPPATLMRGVAGGLAALNGDGQVVDAAGDVLASVADVLTKAGNLTGIASTATARTNLGLANLQPAVLPSGDTSGVTDAAAINAAMVAAPVGATIPLVPNGVYYSNANMIMNGKTGVTLDGNRATVNLVSTGARISFTFQGASTDCHYTKLVVIGNGVIGDQHAGFVVHDSVSNVITDCSVTDCRIINCTLGVSCELSASGGTVNGWTVDGNFIDTPTGTAPGYGYGIHISAGVQTTPTGAHITNNTIRNAQRHSIYSAHGIGTVISGNTIWGHRTGVNSGTVTAAINVLRSSKVTVTGNTCQFGWDGAFNFASDTGAADTLTCVGNTFTDPMDAVSVVNLGDPTPTPTTATRNAFFGPNTVSTKNTGPLVTIFCGVNVYVQGATLNYNNSTGGSAVVLYGYGDSASALFNNNIVISGNAITMEGGGTNYAFRLAGIEATTATVDFRNNPLSGVPTTFIAAANPTNPNMLFNGHKTDGLTFAAGVGVREVPLAPVLFIPNAPMAPPTTTPGGMYLWSQGGALRGHVTNGTKTIIGNVTSTAANYAVAVTDEVVLASGGSGGITCTLPASTRGMRFIITKVDNTAGAVTIATTSSQLINGASTLVLPTQYDLIELVADGTGWAAFGLPASKITTTAVAPGLIPTYLAFLTTLAAAAWPLANTAIFQRFTVPVAGTYRYANFRIDVSSGNIQYGVVKLSGTGLTNYTRVMTSGVIAAPTAGDQHGDLGSTALAPGEYAFFLWCDNTTLTTRYGSNSGISSSQCAGSVAGLTTTGVPASGSVNWNSTSFLAGVTIGRDV